MFTWSVDVAKAIIQWGNVCQDALFIRDIHKYQITRVQQGWDTKLFFRNLEGLVTKKKIILVCMNLSCRKVFLCIAQTALKIIVK